MACNCVNVQKKLILQGWRLDANVNFEGEHRKMAKSTRKRAKGTIPVKKTKKSKTRKGQIRATECIDCLLELHKLQGELLSQLAKEI